MVASPQLSCCHIYVAIFIFFHVYFACGLWRSLTQIFTHTLQLRVFRGGKARRQVTPLPHVIPPLLMNAVTCDWRAAHCFEIPPPASLVCGRSEVLRGCSRGREIRTLEDCHTLSSAGYSSHLSRILMSSDYSWCLGSSFFPTPTLDKGIFR